MCLTLPALALAPQYAVPKVQHEAAFTLSQVLCQALELAVPCAQGIQSMCCLCHVCRAGLSTAHSICGAASLTSCVCGCSCLGQFNYRVQIAWLWLDVAVDCLWVLDTSIMLVSALGLDQQECAQAESQRSNPSSPRDEMLPAVESKQVSSVPAFGTSQASFGIT